MGWNLRHGIPADELKRLYLDQDVTIEEIAQHLGCGATTVKRRMDELGIAPRPRGSRPISSMSYQEWTPTLAYAVGLIATDGNLSGDGRHMTMVSKDRDLLETFRICLDLDNQITRHLGISGLNYRVQ